VTPGIGIIGGCRKLDKIDPAVPAAFQGRRNAPATRLTAAADRHYTQMGGMERVGYQLHRSSAMDTMPQFHPEYVTDSDGNKKAVILPIEEYEDLLEDLQDLAIAAERKNEPTVSHEQLLAELNKDGLLPN
jgi:hypothetical protein